MADDLIRSSICWSKERASPSGMIHPRVLRTTSSVLGATEVGVQMEVIKVGFAAPLTLGTFVRVTVRPQKNAARSTRPMHDRSIA
jgi:hypothetical protein